MRALKHPLYHGLILKKRHSLIQFNPKSWLKPYIDINTKLRIKHRDIKLVTTNNRRNQLVSEPNYDTLKQFLERYLATEMKKTKVKMKKPAYLDNSIFDISNTLLCDFWYDYIKPKYQDKAKLSYMDADSLILDIKTEDFYEDIADDVEKWFDTSNYSKDDKRPLSIGMEKIFILRIN